MSRVKLRPHFTPVSLLGKTMNIRIVLGTALAIAGAATIATHGVPLAAQHAHDQAQGLLEAPAALKAEHEDIHRALAAILKLPGKTGEVARQVESMLGPHFTHEEEVALPQLWLLRALGTGAQLPTCVPPSS
jgi:hypothetical protein